MFRTSTAQAFPDLVEFVAYLFDGRSALGERKTVTSMLAMASRGSRDARIFVRAIVGAFNGFVTFL